MFIANGFIRKISVGDLKTGITYMVGQPMRGGATVITEIRLDVDGSQSRGSAKYDILTRSANSDNSMMWKSIEGMSVVVEYDTNEIKDVEDK